MIRLVGGFRIGNDPHVLIPPVCFFFSVLFQRGRDTARCVSAQHSGGVFWADDDYNNIVNERPTQVF